MSYSKVNSDCPANDYRCLIKKPCDLCRAIAESLALEAPSKGKQLIEDLPKKKWGTEIDRAVFEKERFLCEATQRTLASSTTHSKGKRLEGSQNMDCANGDFACLVGKECQVCKVIAQTTPVSSATSATSTSSATSATPEISEMFKMLEMLEMLESDKKPVDDMKSMFAALLSFARILDKPSLGKRFLSHERDERGGRCASLLNIEIVETEDVCEEPEPEMKHEPLADMDTETNVLKSNMEKIRSLAKADLVDIQLYLKVNKVKIVNGMLWINDKLHW